MRKAIFTLLIACGGGDAPDDALEAPPDCDARPLAFPTARGEVAGAWDAGRGRMVFFGGDHGTPQNCQAQTDFVGETWAFHTDCDSFEEIVTSPSPPARGRHVAAPDEARGRMIVHGGRFREGTSGEYTLRGDTWAFDFAADTWERLAGPNGGPSPRTNHVGVVIGDRFVIHGGNDSADGASFRPLGDTWALDLTTNTWSQLPTTGDVGARLFHAGATDGRRLYVYSGGDENAFFGPFFSGLWALDLETLAWSRLHAGGGGAPLGRIWANLVYDADGHRLLLWGGHDDGALGNNNEMWSFDLLGGGWKLLRGGDLPNNTSGGLCDFPHDFTLVDLGSPERRNANVGALTHDGELLIFGGKTDCGLIDDVWGWSISDGRWTLRSRATEGESCVRAYDDCTTHCF